jgi:hypothetical protein
MWRPRRLVSASASLVSPFSCNLEGNNALNVCNETNVMHYLSSVYSVSITLHVSGLLVYHHQEVTRCWKLCPRASIQVWTRLILFANTFFRSACEMFLMYAFIAVFNSLSVRGWSRYTADFAAPHRYRSLSAQRLYRRTVVQVCSLMFDYLNFTLLWFCP